MNSKRIVAAVVAAAAAGGFALWYFVLAPEPDPRLLLASGTVEATDAQLGFQLPYPGLQADGRRASLLDQLPLPVVQQVGTGQSQPLTDRGDRMAVEDHPHSLLLELLGILPANG